MLNKIKNIKNNLEISIKILILYINQKYIKNE